MAVAGRESTRGDRRARGSPKASARRHGGRAAAGRVSDRALILKIGLHKGAAIAVTLNDRLDYFGQTVNIAARVQNLADADELICPKMLSNWRA